MPETNYTERLKSINLLMNGAWRSLGGTAGHSKISKHGPQKERLIQYSSSPYNHISISVTLIYQLFPLDFLGSGPSSATY